ncbi:MAG: TerB family tellurite resistance protein [Cyclobacteriaceae bacterium]|nr:TerB family tellurite resistance protein [Cyclobacteriaceae bacterium]
MTDNYKTGLLYLVHLLISSDGHVDETELYALQQIKKRENIPDSLFNKFESSVKNKKEREIYEEGLKYLNLCTDEERLRAFIILYKMSEVDGWIHVKEVRLLLYSIKTAGIEFDDVVREAAEIPSFK